MQTIGQLETVMVVVVLWLVSFKRFTNRFLQQTVIELAASRKKRTNCSTEIRERRQTSSSDTHIFWLLLYHRRSAFNKIK